MANATIATGGTAQELFPFRIGRQGWSVQNVSNGDLWVSDTGTAVINTNGHKCVPNAILSTPPGYGSGEAVSIIGATTGQTFIKREW